jgi:proline racemase
MTTFDSDLHPRATTGQFSEKEQTPPQVALSGWPANHPRDAAEVLRSATADRATVDREPVGVTQTRAALRNTRGEPDGAIRVVRLTWDSIPAASDAGTLSVVGPKDGRPIIIRIPNGHPRLEITSGYAIVLADSRAGNSVRVADGATATIIAAEGRKVSVHAKPGSVVDLYAENGVHGYQAIDGDAQFTLHADREETNITVSTEPRR